MLEITLGQNTPVAINLIVLVSVFLVLAIFAVVLRIPAKRHTRQKLNLSDYTAFLALVRSLHFHILS